MSTQIEALLDIAEAIRDLATAINELPVNRGAHGSAIVLHCECFHHFDNRLDVKASVISDEK
jgi:hypothetical protein